MRTSESGRTAASALRLQAGDWPLSEAARSRRPAEVIPALLVAGADPARRNRRGETAAHVAAEQGKAASLRELLRACPTLLNARDEAERTPLICAAGETSEESDHGGAFECVQVLLAAGADATLQTGDTSPCTALEWAADAGNESTLRLLVALAIDESPACGMSEGRQDGSGRNSRKFIDFALFAASRTIGRAGCVRALLEAGADPAYRSVHNEARLSPRSSLMSSASCVSFTSNAVAHQPSGPPVSEQRAEP